LEGGSEKEQMKGRREGRCHRRKLKRGKEIHLKREGIKEVRCQIKTN